ncbi:hypothetical protein BGW36DRAFT_358208 [Talaromyces proteolyticus]|uniref:Uncharacterized protein n=1 Tax=Talaromyces proteolyticus TaxID=1131652 RepID=A0AAD4KT03_9EURO|nr:uncharacterized protein BGW36DRAFT_358208 [Talaromyces proteolyticus]KAH8698686.1 hypothetical protein BGW36DRAFT_358208 [Talaromyces proteolyticus]
MSLHSYNRDEVALSVTEFYNALTKLPYVDAKALICPATEENDRARSGINEAELRWRGKTDEAIELLRHLPYLRQPVDNSKAETSSIKGLGNCGKKWMLGPDTISIAYGDGEVYNRKLDEIQPTPGHCVWLTDLMEDGHGTALLIDTNTGTITEYSTERRKIVIDIVDYDKLAPEERWMAYPTWPVKDFFRMWSRRYETLTWMAVYHDMGRAGTALWYIGSQTDDDNDEDESWDSDDESYVPDSEENSSEDDDEYEWDSEYGSDDDYEVSDDEDLDQPGDYKQAIDWLKDHGTDEKQNLDRVDTSRGNEFSLESKTAVSRSISPLSGRN